MLQVTVTRAGTPQRLTVLVACVALLPGLLGCGGNTSTTNKASTRSDVSASAREAWAVETQQLCLEKRAMIARLGYVHITYAGIARAGLPAVKRSLDRYLARLLAVLSDFSRRQRQLTTPPSLSSMMAMANAVDSQSQSATNRLRRDIASSKTPAELSAAFSGWITTTQRLAVRGDGLARQLNLPRCLSGASAASS
jgi:hypothetical protein